MKSPRIGLLALITVVATVLMPVQLTPQKNTSLISHASAQAQLQSLREAHTTQDRKAAADRLHGVGMQQCAQGQFREGLETFQQVLVMYRAIGDRQSEYGVLGIIGLTYEHLGQYSQALKYDRQALDVIKQVGDKTGEELMLRSVGSDYTNVGQYLQALKYLQEALDIAKQVGDKAEEGTVLNHIGTVYEGLAQYHQALKFYHQALDIDKQVGGNKRKAITLHDIGLVYERKGQYAQALNYLSQAFDIAKQMGDEVGEGVTLNSIGLVALDLGQYAQALKFYQQSLDIAKQERDKAGEGKTLNNLGTVSERLGQYAQALKYHQQALDIAKQVGDKAGEGTTLNNLGTVYASLGQYAQALKFYQQTLVILKEIGDKATEGTIIHNIGETYLSLGQYAQALKFYRQALDIAKQVGNKAAEGSNLHGIGEVYQSLGQYAQALKFYRQALVIFKEIGDKAMEGTTLNDIGGVYQSLGQYPLASKTLFAAIEVLESLRPRLTDADKVSLFERQASTYRLLQQALVAQNKIDSALEIAERGRARAFVELLASRLSLPVTATQSTIAPPTAKQIQQIASSQNATLVQYSIIYDPIKVQGKEEWREKLLIWVIPPTGKIVFRWVDLKPLLQQNTSISELALNSPSDVLIAPDSPEVVIQPPESGQKVATPWSHPEVIIFLILIGSSLIGIAVWPGRFLIPKVVQNLQIQPLWLVYLLSFLLGAGSTQWLIFWMTRSQPITQNRNIRNDSLLAQLVSSTRESIGTTNRGLGIVPKGHKASQTNRLKQLHQILIQPIADLLPSDPNARVIFIPQSSLFLVPFPALKDASGKYLIEKHTILTAPSIQTLDLTHKQKQRIESLGVESREALVVGNPTMPKVPPQIGEPPQQLPSLPGAEEEAKSIAALLKTQAVTGNGATKQAILQKMPSARIVHLATHGILDDIRGLGSAIALAPDSKPHLAKPGEINGLLTAEQILNLKLNAELVVLSACDTGRGRITGDGVVGLSRSLISAGVPSVIVSLWSVPDAPTAFLMTEFYRNLQKNPDKAQALRQAMLTTMKQHPNPIDWAAFTLIGEAD